MFQSLVPEGLKGKTYSAEFIHKYRLLTKMGKKSLKKLSKLYCYIPDLEQSNLYSGLTITLIQDLNLTFSFCGIDSLIALPDVSANINIADVRKEKDDETLSSYF